MCKDNVVKKKLFNSFVNKELLEISLTHSSAGKNNNERLEFLGDAVLNFAISAIVYNLFKNSDEGELSQLKSKIVSGKNLAKIAKQLNLQKDIILSKGEEDNGGREKISILAASLEAVIGAYFLDKGINKTINLIREIFAEDLKKPAELDKQMLYKNNLQEYLQKLYKILPEYKVLKESGKPHSKHFLVGVFFKNKCLGKGKGKNKKEAETNAACVALKKLKLL